MKLGARVGFNTMDELASHFDGVDFPVELALPYEVGKFLTIADRMQEVRDFLRNRGVEVLSVHAAQGNLLLDAYDRWAEPAMWLADELGAKSVTFHPNRNRSERHKAQGTARAHLAELQRGAKALAAVETFGGKQRVFYPEEIVDLGLPMVLDTAHLHDDDRILDLIRRHHQTIPTVHLSARGEDEHHLPIDGFCLKVVGLLKDLNWNGGVILEYLPWHHYRARSDLALLQAYLDGKKEIIIPPPDDRFRNEESKWGFA